MKLVYIPGTKEDFISTIKGNGKIYHVLENCELWSEMIYNAAVSEMRPDIVETITLPVEYGWPFKPDKEIYDELVAVLAAKGYELTFNAKWAECCGEG